MVSDIAAIEEYWRQIDKNSSLESRVNWAIWQLENLLESVKDEDFAEEIKRMIGDIRNYANNSTP